MLDVRDVSEAEVNSRPGLAAVNASALVSLDRHRRSSWPKNALVPESGGQDRNTLSFQSQRSRRRKVDAVSSRLASRSYVLAMLMSKLEETNGCDIRRASAHFRYLTANSRS